MRKTRTSCVCVGRCQEWSETSWIKTYRHCPRRVVGASNRSQGEQEEARHGPRQTATRQLAELLTLALNRIVLDKTELAWHLRRDTSMERGSGRGSCIDDAGHQPKRDRKYISAECFLALNFCGYSGLADPVEVRRGKGPVEVRSRSIMSRDLLEISSWQTYQSSLISSE